MEASTELRERRLAIVREHMESENVQQFAEFDLLGSDRIVCERVYFDIATIARQLLGDE